MTCWITIELPGLTDELVVDLRRHADLAGAPFSFVRSKHPGRKRGYSAHVLLDDLEEDPSIASETLDSPAGWPQPEDVRAWLARAMEFLGRWAPQQRFSFQAGWYDRSVPTVPTIEIDLAAFLSMISAGELVADQRYDVNTTS